MTNFFETFSEVCFVHEDLCGWGVFEELIKGALFHMGGQHGVEQRPDIRKREQEVEEVICHQEDRNLRDRFEIP